MLSASNVIQYNGYYGCPYCTYKGMHKFTKPPVPPSEPHNLRSQSDINQWAHETFILGKPVFGVKGLSLLYRFLSIHHIPVDYMHAILEGVVKAFSCSWLNPTYSDLRCYLGKVAKDIDNH